MIKNLFNNFLILYKLCQHIIQGWINLFKYNFIKSYRIKQYAIIDKRLNICLSCEQLNKKFRKCKICGCIIDAKVNCIYKLDTDGFAYYFKDDNKIFYACPKKKW